MASFLSAVRISQAQPEPKRPAPAWLNCLRRPSREPKVWLMAAVSSAEGAPPCPAGDHDVPEERVIHVPAAVVAHRRVEAGDFGHDLLQGQAFELRMGLELGVEIVDVALVVQAVVDLHGLFVDVGLQRVAGIGQGRQGEGRGQGGGHGQGPEQGRQ